MNARSEVAFCSAVQYITENATADIFANLDFLYTPAAEGNCPHSQNLSLPYTWRLAWSSLKEEEDIMCSKIIWLQFVTR
jgi:hypothetical protein